MRSDELETLRRAAGDNGLKTWLEAQLTETVRVLAEAVEPTAMFRAQGQYLFVKRQLNLLDKAKDLR